MIKEIKMRIEQLISFETAKLAKSKGFNESGILWLFYEENGRMWNCEYDNGDKDYRCCTQNFLQKWLRDEHNLHVLPYIMTAVDLKDYTFTIIKPRENGILGCDELLTKENSLLKFEKYEEALEKGLQEALKLIK
jgi:hypothetical protein